MADSQNTLQELVRHLSQKPGHDTVKSELHRLLIEHLHADPAHIRHEERIETHSRVDTLLGNTVFEIKRNLKNEYADAKDQIERYLEDRERKTGQQYCGIVTDGATFEAFELRHGHLVSLSQQDTDPNDPDALVTWLEGILSLSPQLPADALTVLNELGRHSAAYARAAGILRQAWERVGAYPDVKLKRDLWANHLQIVYGTDPSDNDLWFQHTFLVIVAKAFAHCLLGTRPDTAANLLQGDELDRAGIRGAIESDFFDWVLSDSDGRLLVRRIYDRVARFDVSDVGTDVLKVLYESLVDPQQRHDLGEYYTPDWLAKRMVQHHIDDPLTQTVVDPACGSGTFLFHSLKHIQTTAEKAGYPASEIVDLCVEQVFGVDVHPVAIIIARVTYLLAIGRFTLSKRHGEITVPVYLGDAMQWNVRQWFEQSDIIIDVPPPVDRERDERDLLQFPAALVEDPQKFEQALASLVEASDRTRPTQQIRRRISTIARLNEADLNTVATTYERLVTLNADGRDHIWTFVARNLSRPFWLSRRKKADRVIGNPPWLSLRYMTKDMKKRVREGMRGYGIWVGGNLASQQDLSSYFFVRSAQLYVRREGRIGFLMPFAAMTRGQYKNFRTGQFAGGNVAFDQAWVFDDRVHLLFPVPSCALFAKRTAIAQSTPRSVVAHAALLTRRNASEDEIRRRLHVGEEGAPDTPNYANATPYRRAFHNGATLWPRMLCFVNREETNFLAGGGRIPVISRRSSKEEVPWKNTSTLRGYVESKFVRTALLGESIAPYRIIGFPEAIIPYDGDMLSSDEAFEKGYGGLSEWLESAEQLWNTNKTSNFSFCEQLNYFSKLEKQFSWNAPYVVQGASGKKLTACIVRDSGYVFDNSLYWCATRDEREAYYLCSILNSEVTRKLVADKQSRGQWGARHFHKLAFTLPIPLFHERNPVHTQLANKGSEAEKIAAKIQLSGNTSTEQARKSIRDELRSEGVARDIDELVSQLLLGERNENENDR